MKVNHYILAAFGLLAVMPFASCSSSGKKNAKESALAGKVYSAGFLNDKSEFYGYIISFNKDGSAQYFDSKTMGEMSFSYKEDSAKNTFQLFSADDKNNKFDGIVEGSSIKYKTSTGQEVELSSGADNFYNFIVEKYKAWNKEGEVYLAGKDDSGTKVISSIDQYDERKNIILRLAKDSYSQTTYTTKYTYDDEGRLITKRNEYSTTNYNYTKRSDGTTKCSYEDGEDIYNKDGKVIESETYGENSSTVENYKYDDKGNVIYHLRDTQTSTHEFIYETSYTYKYDANGNITYKKAIGRDSSCDWIEDSISQTWFEYDSNNNLIHEKSKHNDDDTSEKWYEYDSNNNLIHKKYKNSNGNTSEEWYMYALYSDGKIKYKITLNNKQD